MRLKMENSPKFKARIGNRERNPVSTGEIYCLLKSWMFISIKHRPEGVVRCQVITSGLPKFNDCALDNSSRVANAANWMNYC